MFIHSFKKHLLSISTVCQTGSGVSSWAHMCHPARDGCSGRKFQEGHHAAEISEYTHAGWQIATVPSLDCSCCPCRSPGAHPPFPPPPSLAWHSRSSRFCSRALTDKLYIATVTMHQPPGTPGSGGDPGIKQGNTRMSLYN